MYSIKKNIDLTFFNSSDFLFCPPRHKDFSRHFLYVTFVEKASFSSHISHHIDASDGQALFLHFTKGKGMVEINHLSYTIMSPCLLILPLDTSLTLNVTSETHLDCTSLLVDGLLLKGYLPILNIEKAIPHLVKIDAYLDGLLSSLAPIIRKDSLDTQLNLHMTLSKILTYCAQKQMHPDLIPDKTPSYIREIQLLFDTSYQEKYTLANLCHRFHVSKGKLTADFKEHLLLSPIRYLIHRRLSVAKELLISTDDPIYSIAIQVGIPHTNHFIQLFKEDTGMTPKAFRNQETHLCL